jgi:hypothetical protein
MQTWFSQKRISLPIIIGLASFVLLTALHLLFPTQLQASINFMRPAIESKLHTETAMKIFAYVLVTFFSTPVTWIKDSLFLIPPQRQVPELLLRSAHAFAQAFSMLVYVGFGITIFFSSQLLNWNIHPLSVLVTIFALSFARNFYNPQSPMYGHPQILHYADNPLLPRYVESIKLSHNISEPFNAIRLARNYFRLNFADAQRISSEINIHEFSYTP